MKACLAAGYPFVFGFTVYESFESDEVAQTGRGGDAGSGRDALGGHAVMAVGYDDASSGFWCEIRGARSGAWADISRFLTRI